MGWRGFANNSKRRDEIGAIEDNCEQEPNSSQKKASQGRLGKKENIKEDGWLEKEKANLFTYFRLFGCRITNGESTDIAEFLLEIIHYSHISITIRTKIDY